MSAPRHSRKLEYGSPYCRCYRCRAEHAETRLWKVTNQLNRLRDLYYQMKNVFLTSDL